MNLKQRLDEDMIALYYKAGDAVGYWGHRYLQAVRRKGGYAQAKEMLEPRTSGQRAGLDRLLEAKRPDLTLEHLVLRPRYRSLFSSGELKTARERLGLIKRKSARTKRERLFPDELELGKTYPEGAKRQVRVNAYERDVRARRACIAAHGTACVVCGLSMKQRYGRIGHKFIHVHHVKPLSRVREDYRVDPKRHLVPVCPNCHAMLHRKDPPFSIQQLRKMLLPTAK